ncbi:Potassium channel [Aspergillus sclerotialis]|uniref:Potassium channel n=1 Tax=Aspergillus sclerotialis TaxID=2070753 RepID=A0A3A2Z3C4_9EURO|nr:Potassium channel [Aspergillus sclerotialis]
MNDQSLSQPTDESPSAERYTGHRKGHEDGRPSSREAAEYPLPVWWWLASTAYPLIVGALGPMANALSICSLAESWMKAIPAGGDQPRKVPEPEWVIVVNAVSLGFAIISNLILLMKMAQRISFAKAQPIVIIGWYITSILLLAILAVFARVKRNSPNPTATFSQAYYYGTFAAGLYFIIASMLLITTYGAYRGHYSREYKLTNSQRSLMLQTIIFLIYLLGGSAVYARIEDWDFLDAVYWADYTLLTIGIGNFAPVTHLGRSLLFPYAVGGILSLGLIVSSIRAQMLETGRQKIAEVVTEKTRKFLIREASSDHAHLQKLVARLSNGPEESEQDRRKREFKVMRQVRQTATLERKWISFLISLIIWMIMWLIGGVAFWTSDQDSHWTYFESLYFAYTTLLTIGFGDFHPSTAWEKSFFVFWTLLAVPTVTILISNIGDTIARTFGDLTIYIGKLTILPGDKPFKELIRDLTRGSWKEKFLNESADQDEPPQPPSSQLDPENTVEDETEARNAIEADEHKKEESARARGDIAAENIHHYHYLLFREVRKMINYATTNLPKEFEYHEWEYFLNLIAGEDVFPETDEKKKEKEKEKGRGNGWSWIDRKSPLLGEKTEVQWLLEALTEALERELRKASRGFHSPENGSVRESNEGGGEG